MTFGDVINSSDEVITIDGYNFNSFDKDTLTIGTDENVINIYYVKRTDLSYKVNYLEKTTNKVLHDQKVQDGMTFEATVKSADEVIDINGYKYERLLISQNVIWSICSQLSSAQRQGQLQAIVLQKLFIGQDYFSRSICHYAPIS